jgi:hypothetical protein
MTETTPAPSGVGTVLLDIGAGTGALILHAPAELDGVEIEISPNGVRNAARTHSRVRERRIGSAVRHAAVYPAVPAGTYTVWRDAVTPAATVTITGGSVASCRWPPESSSA